MFELHPRLAADCIPLLDWPLSKVLLMNDSRFPWLILVPAREQVRELYELTPVDQQQFLRESVVLGKTLMALYQGHKLNVAALGNMVPQLHIHHIVRFETDACWPSPVWGQGRAEPYSTEAAQSCKVRLISALQGAFA
ncbi:MAG: HIT domain-containing protein [Hahellaceae bacterium]|jgi:diadenosine tetraphosphate (Ap4A) HIT family hydrolase|nr:HIT domain-containing protein [Hahellaceae bacterium]